MKKRDCCNINKVLYCVCLWQVGLLHKKNSYLNFGLISFSEIASETGYSVNYVKSELCRLAKHRYIKKSVLIKPSWVYPSTPEYGFVLKARGFKSKEYNIAAEKMLNEMERVKMLFEKEFGRFKANETSNF